jgi:NAD+ kinase
MDMRDETEKDTFVALNDIVMERGDGTHLVILEIYINNEPLTNVKGDGLIISTSTGSTAYSLSSGGTIIHHDVDCILLNAICPHSLSFRSIAFPRDFTLKIYVSSDSYMAFASSDGVKRIQRRPKQGVEISLSDKHCDIIVLEKFISLPIKVWRQKLIDQLGWNSSFKNIKNN